MQYLVSVITDNVDLADAGEEAAIDVFNERLRTEGHWVFAGGWRGPVRPPSSTTVVMRG